MKSINSCVFKVTLPIIIILSAFSLNGCARAMKKQFLKDDFAEKNIALPYRLVYVKVRDRREKKAEDNLKMKVFTKPGTTEQALAKLTPEREGIIQAEVTKYFSGSGPTVAALVEIVKGDLTFKEKWTSSREQVSARTRINLIDPQSNQIIFWAEGEAFYSVDSMFPSRDYLEKLFDKSLRASIYQAAKFMSKDG